MRYTAQMVHASQLPRWLLEQKRDWDVQLWLASQKEPEALGLLFFDEGGACIGCAVFGPVPLYRQVYVDALIVDESRREAAEMPQLFELTRQAAELVARHFGYTAIRWCAPKRAMRRVMAEVADAEAVQTLYEVPVRPVPDRPVNGPESPSERLSAGQRGPERVSRENGAYAGRTT